MDVLTDEKLNVDLPYGLVYGTFVTCIRLNTKSTIFLTSVLSLTSVANVNDPALLCRTLHSTIKVMNPVGEEIIMTMMQRLCGVTCTEDFCSSIDEIKAALIVVLGSEAGEVVIREWFENIARAAPELGLLATSTTKLI